MPTPIREKIATNAAPYLRPGEQVQGAFAGQSISGWWSLLTYLMIFWLRYRSVIVTDQRILMLDTGKWSMTKPKGVVAELPRNVVIGPASGLWWKCLTLGEKLFVHRRFHKDVLAADTLLAQSGQPVQQIPLDGHKSQPGPGQQVAGPGGQQQYGAPAQQYGQPQGQQPSQEQPSPWGQNPRFAEPDEDNRTRIRPAAPRTEQARPEQEQSPQERPES